jgi:hypothetical protein
VATISRSLLNRPALETFGCPSFRISSACRLCGTEP